MLSPSKINVCLPRSCSAISSALAIVLLPLPERPVNHTTRPGCPFMRSRSWRVMVRACLCTFCPRRKQWRIIPTATVACVNRSIKIKLPSSRERSYVSNAIGLLVDSVHTLMSFSANVVRGSCASVFTFTPCLIAVNVAGAFCVDNFNTYPRPTSPGS